MTHLRLPLLVFVLALIVSPSPAAGPSPLRVGQWEVDRHATFAVASDMVGDRLHIVYGDKGGMHYACSTDGGVTWTEPELVGRGVGQVLVVDRRGTVHLVNETGNRKRIEYRSRSGGAWSEPRDLGAWVEGDGEPALCAPRLAVDGADNLHLIYWTYWKGQGNSWKPGSRCVYVHRRAGAADFDPPELWRDRGGQGYARYGRLAVDPAGDLHVFYASGLLTRGHHLERRVRHRDGTWGRHDLWPSRLLTDWCIGAAVTTDGVAHISVQSNLVDGMKVIYMNNRESPEVLAERHSFGRETFETFTDLLALPNGDLWVATGHIEEAGTFPGEPPDEMPDIGTFAHYRAATGTWTARTPVSPEGAVNLDRRQANEPRLVVHGGQVRLFYAEKLPDGKWRHWQRILGPASSTP